MLVKNWMSTKVITVNVRDCMLDALKLLKNHDIRRLPVLKKDNLVGIVTDRDLKRANASDATALEIHELVYLLSEIEVKEIMTKDPITVPFDYTVEEAAAVFFANKISGAPVVDHADQMVGIITQTDLFRVLTRLTGVGKRGIQFAFQVEDRPGSIKDLADIIRAYDGRMVSILSTYADMPEGYRKVYIRMYGINRLKLTDLEGELQKKATLLYMVDHRENIRKIY